MSNDLYTWVARVQRSEPRITSDVRCEVIRLSKLLGWTLADFIEALQQNHRQLRQVLNSQEYAAFLRALQTDPPRDVGNVTRNPRSASCSDQTLAPRSPAASEQQASERRGGRPASTTSSRNYVGSSEWSNAHPQHAEQTGRSRRRDDGGGYPQSGDVLGRSMRSSGSGSGGYPQCGELPSRSSRNGGTGMRHHCNSSASSSASSLRLQQSPGSPFNKSEDLYSPMQKSSQRFDTQDDRSSTTASHRPLGHSEMSQRSRKSNKQEAPVSSALDIACRQIGYKIFQRFTNVRYCLRMLDLDKSGYLSMDEFEFFFRVFNQSRRLAQELFDHLCGQDRQHVSFDSFINFFWSYINPDVEKPLVAPRNEEALPHAIKKTLTAFGDKALMRYSNVRSIIRVLDEDRTGIIGADALRTMFTQFNLSKAEADEVYNILSGGRPNKATPSEFRRVVGSFIEPGGSRADKSTVKTHPIITDIPLTKEVENLLHFVGDKALQKYKSLRGSIRALNKDRDGLVRLSEVRRFFDDFGLSVDQSDMLFGLIDKDGCGQVDLYEFMNFFGPYIAPEQFQWSNIDVSTMTRDRHDARDTQQPPELRELCVRLGSEREAKCKRQEIRKILDALGDKAMQRFNPSRKALALLDRFQGGHLRCSDLEEYFVKVYLSADMGRQVFQSLDINGAGKVSYADVMNLIGPYLQAGFKPLAS